MCDEDDWAARPSTPFLIQISTAFTRHCCMYRTCNLLFLFTIVLSSLYCIATVERKCCHPAWSCSTPCMDSSIRTNLCRSPSSEKHKLRDNLPTGDVIATCRWNLLTSHAWEDIPLPKRSAPSCSMLVRLRCYQIALCHNMTSICRQWQHCQC